MSGEMLSSALLTPILDFATDSEPVRLSGPENMVRASKGVETMHASITGAPNTVHQLSTQQGIRLGLNLPVAEESGSRIVAHR